MNPTPPSVWSSIFIEVPTSTFVLKVPTQSVDAYKSADIWRDFVNIVGTDVTGIDAATIDADTNNAPAYNLQGAKVDSDYRGVVVKNGKKILKK